MRIRKRKVPLPLSLLSPVPLSDPHLFSRSPVHHLHPQPSDHSTPTSASDLRPSILVDGIIISQQEEQEKQPHQQQKPCLGLFQELGERGERILRKNKNTNNNHHDDDDEKSKDDDEVAADNNVSGRSLSNEVSEKGRWSEGERVIPLKKRRSSGTFLDPTAMGENKIKEEENNNNRDQEEKTTESSSNNKMKGSSKQKRGTTIMEGSRCSRVNGRGWRCCQPTLVGYSLCEHHLGKGRLRSMTSVRGRPSSSKRQQKQNNTKQGQKPLNNSSNNTTTSSRKMNNNSKLGVVKARSLSSLLGQTTASSTNNGTNVDGITGSMINRETDNHVVVS